MSRIGKKPVTLPKGVEVSLASGVLTVKGPKGALTTPAAECLEYSLEAGSVNISRKDDSRDARARLVRLTTKGERAQQLVRGLFVEIERDWARQFGVEEFDSLRDLLSRLLVQRVRDVRC